MLRTANFRLSGQKLFCDFKNPFKILAEAEPRLWRGEAGIAQKSQSENWRAGQDSNLPARHRYAQALARRAKAQANRPASRILEIKCMWADKDLHLGRRKPADLQSAPFDYFGIDPFIC